MAKKVTKKRAVVSRYTQPLNYASDSQRDIINASLIDVIMAAVKGLPYDISGDVNRVKYGYVLEQSIRQYLIPKENWHLTKGAESLWNKITDEEIRYFTYDEKFTPIRSISGVPTYTGGNKTNGTTKDVEEGKKMKFTSLFICEHTTPVADIIDELKVLYNNGNFTKQSVKNVLDRIHITRMLRTEDRSIGTSSGRIGSASNPVSMYSPTLFTDLENKFYIYSLNAKKNVPYGIKPEQIGQKIELAY